MSCREPSHPPNTEWKMKIGIIMTLTRWIEMCSHISLMHALTSSSLLAAGIFVQNLQSIYLRYDRQNCLCHDIHEQFKNAWAHLKLALIRSWWLAAGMSSSRAFKPSPLKSYEDRSRPSSYWHAASKHQLPKKEKSSSKIREQTMCSNKFRQTCI